MSKTVFSPVIALVLLLSNFAAAQISITSAGVAIQQDFNSLASSGLSNAWTNNPASGALKGWYAAKSTAGALTYRAQDGASNGANLCSFGATGSNERALGSVGAGGTSFAWGARFQNDLAGSLTITSIKIEFKGEQWRVSNELREHFLKFSYKISAGDITTFAADEVGYTRVPFLNFVSPTTTGADAKLSPPSSNTAILQFRVSLMPGHEIMLKWFDEDVIGQFDHALAIDDVKVTFFTGVPNITTDEYSGTQPFQSFMKSLISELPDAGSGAVFALPTANQLTTWGNAMTKILAANYSGAYTDLTSTLGYRLTKFTSGGKTYYIASKDGGSTNYWGTYVFNPTATRLCVNLQAPHPLDDELTGEQSAFFFEHLSAYSLAVAGSGRCLSNTLSGCHGTSECGNQVISDMAHALGTAWQKTTEVMASGSANRRFIQLHGFAKAANDKHFYLSNGTKQTPATDHVTNLKNSLQAAAGKGWTAITAHPTDPGQLSGYNNVQGRLLNNYANGNLCSSNIVSTTVTGRFMHVEQYEAARTDTANYPVIGDILKNNSICNCAGPLAIVPPADLLENVGKE